MILIALLQYPLWLGKGSWLRVWDLNQQISQKKDKNVELKQRNDTLDAEVHDLKQGNAAIEERARSELGMIKQDEVFYQVLEPEVVHNSTLKEPRVANSGLPSANTSKPKTNVDHPQENHVKVIKP